MVYGSMGEKLAAAEYLFSLLCFDFESEFSEPVTSWVSGLWGSIYLPQGLEKSAFQPESALQQPEISDFLEC